MLDLVERWKALPENDSLIQLELKMALASLLARAVGAPTELSRAQLLEKAYQLLFYLEERVEE